MPHTHTHTHTHTHSPQLTENITGAFLAVCFAFTAEAEVHEERNRVLDAVVADVVCVSQQLNQPVNHPCAAAVARVRSTHTHTHVFLHSFYSLNHTCPTRAPLPVPAFLSPPPFHPALCRALTNADHLDLPPALEAQLLQRAEQVPACRGVISFALQPLEEAPHKPVARQQIRARARQRSEAVEQPLEGWGVRE